MNCVCVLERCGKFLVIAVLVLTTGAHWAALQTVAWAAMLASNLRSDTLSSAVSKTLDGQHPCCLCKAIAAAKKSGQKSEAIASALKMEFPPAAEHIVLIAPSGFRLLPQIHFATWALTHEPPVPPPRCFLS